MRGKGKQTIVWLLMGMLVLGLGGFGVTNFSGGTADVGAVGDVEISSQDYARALRTEIQGFAAQTGRQLTPAEAKSIGLDQAALSRLYVAAALEDEARRIGLSVGDDANTTVRVLIALGAVLIIVISVVISKRRSVVVGGAPSDSETLTTTAP